MFVASSKIRRSRKLGAYTLIMWAIRVLWFEWGQDLELEEPPTFTWFASDRASVGKINF